MDEKEYDYILVYGSRRIDACRKLGWKTIPSLVNRDGKVTLEDIPIDRIKILDNVRIIRDHVKDVSELMSSVKQDGLLEPIATIPYNPNLSEESLLDLIIKNTVENIQREDITATEQGRIFYRLKKEYKMTNSEIASRFGIANNRVKNAMHLFKSVPPELHSRIKFFPTGRSEKKGDIPASIGIKILYLRDRYHLNHDQVEQLFKIAKDEDFSKKKAEGIAYFLSIGKTLDEAITTTKRYVTIHNIYQIRKDERVRIINKYKDDERFKGKNAFQKVLRAILAGELNERVHIPDWDTKERIKYRRK